MAFVLLNSMKMSCNNRSSSEMISSFGLLHSLPLWLAPQANFSPPPHVDYLHAISALLL